LRLVFHLLFAEISILYGSFRFGIGRAHVMGGSDMFRISTIDTQRERRLVVEGTLVQPWVAELRRTWSDAGASLDGRQMVIDLSNATTIDAEGEKVISDLMKEGAKFCCSGVLTKHVLKQLAHRCNTRLRNVLNQSRTDGRGRNSSLRDERLPKDPRIASESLDADAGRGSVFQTDPLLEREEQ
jgi:hypothetical protein